MGEKSENFDFTLFLRCATEAYGTTGAYDCRVPYKVKHCCNYDSATVLLLLTVPLRSRNQFMKGFVLLMGCTVWFCLRCLDVITFAVGKTLNTTAFG